MTSFPKEIFQYSTTVLEQEVGGERVWANGLGGRVSKDEECGLKSSYNCAKAYGGVPAARVKLFYLTIRVGRPTLMI